MGVCLSHAGDSDYTDRCPDVGDQMPAVGLERDRALLASDSEEKHRHDQVEDRGSRRDRDANAHVAERLRVQQARHGHPHDPDRSNGLKLVVAPGAFPVGLELGAVQVCPLGNKR
jgi:hypothetical protein